MITLLAVSVALSVLAVRDMARREAALQSPGFSPALQKEMRSRYLPLGPVVLIVGVFVAAALGIWLLSLGFEG